MPTKVFTGRLDAVALGIDNPVLVHRVHLFPQFSSREARVGFEQVPAFLHAILMHFLEVQNENVLLGRIVKASAI